MTYFDLVRAAFARSDSVHVISYACVLVLSVSSVWALVRRLMQPDVVPARVLATHIIMLLVALTMPKFIESVNSSDAWCQSGKCLLRDPSGAVQVWVNEVR